MTEPAEDRVLEVALEEVLGGIVPPDLSASIRAAVRRSSPRRQAAAPHRLLFRVAAALLVAAGLGVTVWLALSPDGASPGGPTVAPGASLSAAQVEELDRLLTLQCVETAELDPTTAAGRDRIKEIWEARRALAASTRTDGPAWRHVRSAVAARMAGGSTDVRRNLLEVLASGPDPATDGLVLGALADRADEVDDLVLLRLTERHVPGAESLLEDRLAGPPAPWLVLPAAYFALRGDGRGEQVLRVSVTDAPSAAGTGVEAMVAAVALRALGDGRPWTDAVDRSTTLAMRALDEGRIEDAARISARLEFFDRLAGGDGRPAAPLSDLRDDLGSHEERRSAGPATAAAVRERLRSFRDR